MRLLIIRHGESQADLLGVHEGRADFELTQRGLDQAKALACYVSKHYSLSAIYCSPLKRAWQTGLLLSQMTKVPLFSCNELMEFDNGLIAGMDKRNAREKYPRIHPLPIHTSVYEQESLLSFRFRAEYILSRMMSEQQGDSTVAAITHGGMINQLYHAFLCLPVDSNFVIRTGDTGIHEWLISDESRQIICANRLIHRKDL